MYVNGVGRLGNTSWFVAKNVVVVEGDVLCKVFCLTIY